MQKVNGIGGFFFTASDPDMLGDWYRDHLGIERVPQSYDAEVWCQTEGPTVFAPFGADGGRRHPRRSPGVGASTSGSTTSTPWRPSSGRRDSRSTSTTTVYPNGRFATLADPDGNPVQLWQPA